MDYFELIVNEDGSETIRPYTEAEIEQRKKEEAIFAAREKELADKQQARQALLEKLGITEEEAKLLLS